MESLEAACACSARSYACLTADGVAAMVVDSESTAVDSCTIPATLVEAGTALATWRIDRPSALLMYRLKWSASGSLTM